MRAVIESLEHTAHRRTGASRNRGREIEMSIPKTERVDAAPGIRIVRFLEPATDAAGRLWPAGTEMSPLSFGYDNGAEQRAFVKGGREIIFYAE